MCPAPASPDVADSAPGGLLRPSLGFVALLLVPAWASACGGFFCSNSPVDQVGENILFFPGEGGTLNAHVQISYQGDTDEFSWVVPVEGVPTVGLSSEILFQQLAFRTAPSWELTIGDSDCADPYAPGSWLDDADNDGFGDDDSAGGDDVEVLSEQDVGAYHATVLATTDAQALLDWLNCHGYRIAYSALPRVQAYLNDGENFLALRLRTGANAGDLVPISMNFPGEHPMIPLVLIAIASQPNLRVRAWFLGDGRAVPYNYDHIWLNDARIDYWQSSAWGSPYGYDGGLLAAAVDEAGGHAFVTEYAGASDLMAAAIFPLGGYPVDELRSESDPAAFLQQALWMGLPRNGMMQSILRQHIPMPQSLVDQGVTEQEFYNCLTCYPKEVAAIAFDPSATVDAILLLLLDPMEEAQALFDDPAHPILTRMSSVLSGWEMNVDPDFLWLPAPLDKTEVEPDSYPWERLVPARRQRLLDFIGGDSLVSCWEVAQVVRTEAGPGVVFQQPYAKGVEFPEASELPSCQDLPAAMVIERWNIEGEVELVADRRAEIAAMVSGGYCEMTPIPAATVDPPSDVGWPESPEMMPVEAPDPEICAALEAAGDTGLGEDWEAGDDDAGDDDATGAPVDAVVDGCVGGCGHAGGGSGWGLAVLGGLAFLSRRRVGGARR